MIWTVSARNTIDYMISYPTFEGETKKESKCAQRMNRFYLDIIDAAIKSFSKKEYKCYLDVTAEERDTGISVLLSYRARHRGRTIESFSHNAIWKNGYMLKKQKHAK